MSECVARYWWKVRDRSVLYVASPGRLAGLSSWEQFQIQIKGNIASHAIVTCQIPKGYRKQKHMWVFLKFFCVLDSPLLSVDAIKYHFVPETHEARRRSMPDTLKIRREVNAATLNL